MPTRQQYNEVFLKELERLNTAQRKAVEQIDGPVLVIAGPGTGKTHILSARIGRILMDTDTQPYNILCLTFTDAGVRAMRERLLQFIGPEAHRVHIYTFHSFCNNIIQDNPAYFGANALEPISELEQIELMQELIDGLNALHPLKRGRNNPYFYLRHLKDLFQLMKREHWSVQHIEAQVKTFLSDLPNRKEFIYQVSRGKFKKGMLKKAKVEETQHRMLQLVEAAKLFPKYLRKMKKARRYDYDDMILWVLKAFEHNEALLRRYQEQYLYFLVDEYQDTNGAQNEVLQRLMDFWNTPNVFIVGDDDQSIYEFQGARLKNIRDFHDRYEQEVELVILTDNYRSTQSILDTASSLIEHNEKRLLTSLSNLGLQKRLVANHQTFAQLTVHPQIIEYPNRLQEDVAIVQQIEQLWRQGFPLEEIAVIYAQHRQVDNMLTLLEKKGIPYNVKRRVNILDEPLIWNLRLLLEYIAAEYEQPYQGEHLLYQLLHIDFIGIDARDIGILSQYLAKKYDETWRNCIFELPKELFIHQPKKLQAFTDFLRRVIQDYQNFPLPMLLERILNRSGLLQFVLKQEEKAWLTQVIKTFFDFVKEEAHRSPQLTIRQLLAILKNMEDNRLRLEVSKMTVAKAGVNLLTAHGSKGLEFEKVFLIDCVKDYWEPRRRSGSYNFILPDTLTYSGEEDVMEARRRLFYVSMTRAKAQLHISYAKDDQREKPLQRAVFIDEILTTAGENAIVEVQEQSVAEKDVLAAQTLLLFEMEQPIIKPLNEDVIRYLLEDFRLSVSSLNVFLRCPLSFFYGYVLRVPTLMSEAASYGEAMHKTFQRAYEVMLSRKNKMFPARNQFLRFFEEEMQYLRPNFSPATFKRKLEAGKQNLLYYHQNHLKKWEKAAKVEFNIRHVEVVGIPMTGTIDKIEFVGLNEVRIVDYKTGRADESKLSPKSKKLPNGGSYYRQLLFYKLLYENLRPTNSPAKTGTVIFLDPTPRGQYLQKTISLEDKDVQFMKEILSDTYEKIQSHQFYQGCGEKNCVWCNFVKKNKLVDSLSDASVEDLDD